LIELFELLAAFQPPAPMPSPGAVAGTPTICGTLQSQLLTPVGITMLSFFWIISTCVCTCAPPLCCVYCWFAPIFLPFDILCIAGSCISWCTMPVKVCCGFGSGIETMIYQNMLPSEVSTWCMPLLSVCGGGGGGPTILLPM